MKKIIGVKNRIRLSHLSMGKNRKGVPTKVGTPFYAEY